jgi:hypothetical protein
MNLHQIIAVVAGKKSRATKQLTECHRWPPEPLRGISRVYTPLDDAGVKLPQESAPVQIRVDDAIEQVSGVLADFFDMVATQETGNTTATASVKVAAGRVPLLEHVPVTVLLFLEKQLVDLRTFVAGLPTLPADRTWTYDGNRNCHVAEPQTQTRTQKTPTVIVKYDATPEHPAQTELFAKDDIVGQWETTHFSGAMPAADKAVMLARVEELQDAVKTARSEANGKEVKLVTIGKTVLDYIFKGNKSTA